MKSRDGLRNYYEEHTGHAYRHKSQGNHHDGGTIGLENGRDLITVSRQSLADQINRVETENSGGS